MGEELDEILVPSAERQRRRNEGGSRRATELQAEVLDAYDDRLIACALEIMRTNPNSSVVLVTRDMNLQNKAELARIPFVEPPNPPPSP